MGWHSYSLGINVVICKLCGRIKSNYHICVKDFIFTTTLLAKKRKRKPAAQARPSRNNTSSVPPSADASLSLLDTDEAGPPKGLYVVLFFFEVKGV
jgi:hypothetical protein